MEDDLSNDVIVADIVTESGGSVGLSGDVLFRVPATNSLCLEGKIYQYGEESGHHVGK